MNRKRSFTVIVAVVSALLALLIGVSVVQASSPKPLAGALTDGYPVQGTVWTDTNTNGVFDQGEGVTGVTVTLAQDQDVVGTTVSGIDGTYDLGFFPEGIYWLSANKNDSMTGGMYITVTSPPPAYNVQVSTICTNRIEILVFDDKDGNGEWDPGESGIPNVLVKLYDYSRFINLGEKWTLTDGRCSFDLSDPWIDSQGYTIDTWHQLTTTKVWMHVVAPIDCGRVGTVSLPLRPQVLDKRVYLPLVSR